MQVGKSYDGARVPAAVRRGTAFEAVRALGLNTEPVVVIYVSGDQHGFGSVFNAGCVRSSKVLHWDADSVVASARRHIRSVAAKATLGRLKRNVIGESFSTQEIADSNSWRRYLTAVLQRNAYLCAVKIWQRDPQIRALGNYQRLLHRVPLQISSNDEGTSKYHKQSIENYLQNCLQFIHKRFTAPIRMLVVVVLFSFGLLAGIKGNMELVSGRILRGTALVVLTFVLGAFAMLIFASGALVFPA